MTIDASASDSMRGEGALSAPNSKDREIGARVQTLRRSAGLSQHDLAEALGIPPQQVGKYERGQNPISAGRLAEIASTLGATTAAMAGFSIAPFNLTPEAAELAQAFDGLVDPRDRAALSHMAHRLAKAGSEPQ